MKAAKRPPILQTSIAALLAMLISGSLPATAATLTWTGATSNQWDTNTNWNPNGTPAAAAPPADLVFTGAVNTNSDNNNAPFVQSITFDQNASAFNLFDQPVFLNGGSAIVNNSPFLQTLSFTDVFGLGGIGIFNFGGANNTITANTAPILITSTIGFDSPVTLTFNGASNIVVTGAIIDEGTPPNMSQVVIAGPGMVTFTAQNMYPGNTWVTGGTLNLVGSIASLQTFVMSGGTLIGTGVVGGNLFNAGNVAPGDAPGTLTVKGNYIQSATGTLTIQVAGKNPGQYSALAVQGTASLNGDLRIVALGNGPKLKVGQHIDFLTAAGGVTGRFASVSDPLQNTGTIVSDQVVYHSDKVSLQGVQGSFADLSGLTPNERSVAGALDHLASHDAQGRLISFLDGESLSNLPADFDRIAPEELTSIFTMGVALDNVQAMNLQRRMDDIRYGSHGFSASGFAAAGSGPLYSGSAGVAGPSGDDGKESKEMKTIAPTEDRWGVFITGVGEWVNVSGDNNARGYDITTGGFTVGADYKLTDNFAVGINAGYAGTSSDLTDHGRIWVNGGKLGLYSTYFTGGFYVDTAATGGYNSYDTRRSALQGTARGDTDGGEVNLLFSTGYDWKVGGFTIGPTASFQYTYVGIRDFNESGSLAPLEFPGQNQDSLRTAFGMKASYDWKLGGIVIKPELRAAWQHEFGDNTYSIQSTFDGASDDFRTSGPKIGRDSLLLGAGFAIMWNERTSTYVYYDGELARTRYDENSVSGGVRVSF